MSTSLVLLNGERFTPPSYIKCEFTLIINFQRAMTKNSAIGSLGAILVRYPDSFSSLFSRDAEVIRL